MADTQDKQVITKARNSHISMMYVIARTINLSHSIYFVREDIGSPARIIFALKPVLNSSRADPLQVQLDGLIGSSVIQSTSLKEPQEVDEVAAREEDDARGAEDIAEEESCAGGEEEAEDDGVHVVADDGDRECEVGEGAVVADDQQTRMREREHEVEDSGLRCVTNLQLFCFCSYLSEPRWSS
ncbi:unnamed protein product [Triticum turgidum subsp. durum]|uniref:Uncharacterized protein n=1 Tax=Triticum turgidum subsp. durum TaxID=4567 RepID=A0A9R0WIB9_TRITD|nr:unnamed protein product [Triticum turgidum subsp. durum]